MKIRLFNALTLGVIITLLIPLSPYRLHLTEIQANAGEMAPLAGSYRTHGAGAVPLVDFPGCAAVTEIPAEECEALVALYNSTNGSVWINNTGWLATSTPCSWYGIGCADNHVIFIHLNENGLSGPMPPELGSLGSLQDLNLAYNQMGGTIPPELGNLANLEQLHLQENGLTGSIPSSLGNLVKLWRLVLETNELSGPIPAELGSLVNMLDFGLYDNQLSGSIPPQLGNLTKVAEFGLGENQLTGSIPPPLGNLTQAVDFSLSNNRLNGPVPSQLGNLASVENLNLNGNVLSGEVPTTLTDLSNLTQLRLDFNMLTAANPAVATFLDSKNPGWANSQTVAPSGLAVSNIASRGIQLVWSPILYTGNDGYYQISYATTPGGPYTDAPPLGNKYSTNYSITGLNPDTTYYFILRSYTPAHPGNQNNLLSPPSPQIFVTTDPVVMAVVNPTGGSLTAETGLTTTLTFPPAAVNEPVEVTVETTLENLTTPDSLSLIGKTFSVEARTQGGVPITTFAEPFTVVMEYNEADLPDEVDEEQLSLYFWNESSGAWEEIPSTVDPETNTITVVLDHLTTFAVMGSSREPVYLPLILRNG